MCWPISGSKEGNNVVRKSRENLQLLAMTDEEKDAHHAVLDTPDDHITTDPQDNRLWRVRA